MGTTAQFRPTFGLIKTVGAALALAGLVAGCSVAGASPSASQASPSASQASPSASQASPSASQASPSAAGSPSPSAVASASASTSPSAAPATIGPAPSGTWTSLKWVDEHNAFPQTPTPSTGDGGTQNSLFGWSKGYIGFRTAYDISTGNSPAKTATVSTSSGEGVHWTAGRPMDIEGLKGAIFVSEVIEGPSGLLALGFYGATACGGPTTVDAFWTSLDGSSWTRVALSGDFASASIYTVDGGSVGFIATGTLKDGTTQAIWTSTDGRNWRRAAVPTVATGTFVLNGATGFASGYVVGGAIQGDEGCGGFNLLTPSLWWSATGSSWTRVKLPGATPASDATMTVTRISDHVLMAIAWESNGAGVTTQTVWYTSNGHDWKLVASPSALLGGTVVSDGRRGLVVSTPPESGMPVVATVGDDLSVTPLVETGAVPGANGSGIFAVGPAGVVCLSNDGTSLSLGVPAE